MRAWLTPLAEILSRGEAAMLVHLAELRGSAPREVGAQMLVTEHTIVGSIGGGELERMAMMKAREMLHTSGAGVMRLGLGPELNQCCGGSVTLAFEPFAPADLAWVKKLIRAAEEPMPVVRTLTIEAAGGLRRDWTAGGAGHDYSVEALPPSPGVGAPSPLAGEGGLRRQPKVGRGVMSMQLPSPPLPPLRQVEGAPSPARGEGGTLEIRERINPELPALWLFGAGHVGRAVVPALHPLGFAITWIDGRAGQFPEPALPGVKQLALAMPELAVEEAPPGSFFLVMTHSHPLDEAICEAVLRREDYAYLGLIGSKTKRARFVKRLGETGISEAALERLVCPIGLTAIENKEPAAIAASVAADLLIRREKITIRAGEASVHGR